jgi:hypothetical protein
VLIKTIGFAGLSSKDMILYCAYMICQCNQKVLVIDFNQTLEGMEKIEINKTGEIYKVGNLCKEGEMNKVGNPYKVGEIYKKGIANKSGEAYEVEATYKEGKTNRKGQANEEGTILTNDSEVNRLERIDSMLPLIENYMGIDYLHFDSNFYSIYEALSNEYDFIILDAFELNPLNYNIACCNLFNMCEHLYMVTDLRKANLEQVADMLKVVDTKWNLIYRNICNKRFDRTLLHQLYPDCQNIDKEYDLWLDSFDQYYQMCVEYGIRQVYRRLSKDMRRCLIGILTSLDTFSGKQMMKAMKQLQKGGI